MGDRIKPGWVWVEGKGGWRPFIKKAREIRKGKRKGMVEVTLPSRPERKIIVEEKQIRRYPVKETQLNVVDFANGLLAGHRKEEESGD